MRYYNGAGKPAKHGLEHYFSHKPTKLADGLGNGSPLSLTEYAPEKRVPRIRLWRISAIYN
jgi:hypothetical protein